MSVEYRNDKVPSSGIQRLSFDLSFILDEPIKAGDVIRSILDVAEKMPIATFSGVIPLNTEEDFFVSIPRKKQKSRNRNAAYKKRNRMKFCNRDYVCKKRHEYVNSLSIYRPDLYKYINLEE
jgi:hypothetical protein